MKKLIKFIKLKLKEPYIFLIGEEKWAMRKYKKSIGKIPNLTSPEGLNEKIVWLKLHYNEEFYRKACDKYLLHDYLKEKLGKDYAPELLFVTQNPNELTVDNIKKFPCIIKVSNGSGANLIVKNKNQYSNDYLQGFFKEQIIVSNAHAVSSLEHQYLTKNPYIVVEKLLSDGKGGIPNDYKFLFINGKLQFIYCSVDRLGDNVRQIYNEHWERQHFIWVAGANREMFDKYDSSPSIDKPVTFDKMIELANIIAKDFPLVRVDFYEENGIPYIGEITLHHGSGGDAFYPEKYDLFYGEKLKLPKANR